MLLDAQQLLTEQVIKLQEVIARDETDMEGMKAAAMVELIWALAEGRQPEPEWTNRAATLQVHATVIREAKKRLAKLKTLQSRMAEPEIQAQLREMAAKVEQAAIPE
jgi:hypothetical protein